MSTDTQKKSSLARRIFNFYVDGFRNMTWGKTTWMIIGIKLFVMFAILKVFLFPNFLKSKGDTPEERTNYIQQEYERRALLGDDSPVAPVSEDSTNDSNSLTH